MPLHSESPSTNLRQEFCLALKAARERKGITLAEIANTTKIPASVFAAFERSDLRRWPRGLFRRSFFRDYARMIGVPVAETCAEFVRLFPDDEGAAPAATPAAGNDQAEPLPLVLDAAWHGPRAPIVSRLLAALIDAAGVIFVAAAIAWLADKDQLATTAIFALTYSFLATVVFDESPAKWAIARRRPILDALSQGPAAVAAAWKHGADAMSQAFGSAAGAAPEPEEEPVMHAWVTDARRVSSAPAPRFRVRIKVPQ